MSKQSEFMENQSNKTIAVIGLGYVGLPLALLAERKGYKVIGLDINEEKINSLIKREPLADEVVSNQLKNSTIELTTDFEKTKNGFMGKVYIKKKESNSL